MKYGRYCKRARPSVVALFTRAWIEMNCGGMDDVDDAVALFTRAWIEIATANPTNLKDIGRPLHEGVD